jgi:uncharacterized protein (TIGR00251 family)
MKIENYVKDKKLKIIVKPNSPKNKILEWDKNRNALRVNIKERPESNRANIEIVKFFSKLTGKRIKIIRGLKSKKKILLFE